MKAILTRQSLLILCLILALHNTGFATKFLITVQNFNFNPADLPNVHVGDTIQWNWVNGSHTTTSTTLPTGAPTWDHPLNSTSTSFEYKVTVAGTYNYKCTPHDSMGMLGSFTATPASGITETRAGTTILIYPDPVRTTATVNYRSEVNQLSVIKIFDITGKLVIERRVEGSAPGSDLTLDMTNLFPGIYFAAFYDENNEAVVRRLVKQ
jgi:plastocyanin